MFDTLPSALPHVREGRLRALGVTAPQRLAEPPGLPTVAETVPGFEMGVWVGLFAPAGTPQPIIDRADAATRNALAAPELRARFAELGLEPFPAGPEELATHLKAEIEKWIGVVRGANIRID